MELLNIHDNGIHLWFRRSPVYPVCVLKKEVPVVQPGQGIRLHGRDQLPLLAGSFFRLYAVKQQNNNDQRNHDRDCHYADKIISEKIPEGHPFLKERIGRQ